MKLFMAFFAVLILAGCGPRYVTDYDLYPADTARGKQEAMQCDLNKERCEKQCYQRALQCEKFNDHGYGPFGSIGSGGSGNIGIGASFPLGGYDSGRSCNTTSFCEQSCREDQIDCYQKTGGTVKAREPRCVSGCSAGR